MDQTLLTISLSANIALLAWLAREVYGIRIMLENFNGRILALENKRKKR